MKAILSLLIILLTISTTHYFSQTDKEGSADHSLIPRFDRSYIYEYELTSFDSYTFATGKETSGKISSTKTIEGKVYRIFYILPTDAGSNYEIFTNFKNALKSKGAEIIFEGKDKSACGKYFWDNIPTKYLMPAYFGEDQAFLASKFSKDGKVYYVTIMAGYGLGEQGYEIHVVEVDEMKQQVTLEGIESALNETGKMSLYGILFDTGSDILKPDSKKEISLIADYLKKHPEKKIYIVGHTDNSGDLSKNQVLSEKRAQAVIKVLTTEYGIDLSRLTGIGVGPSCPVGKNTTENGRLLNRRVEIVLNEH
ncbi:MAG: OmpA family protein [Flavobacteriales bacterium]|nr:OmpA family protein [Flavobacteriales bacterium]